jgi:hypothetical protein
MRPLLSTSDKRLSAGSTSRVAWKAKPRSRCMVKEDGKWGCKRSSADAMNTLRRTR